MKHPLEFLPPEARKPAFLLFLVFTILLFAIFRFLDVPLRTKAAPNGIVSFELAGTRERASEMLASWGGLNELGGLMLFQPARSYLAFGLGLDYLFMPVYAIALALAVLLASGRHTGRLGRVGTWVGWAALAAPFFDAVENYALLQLALGRIVAPWPGSAAFCASVKFALLAVGIVYALAAWLLPAKRFRREHLESSVS